MLRARRWLVLLGLFAPAGAVAQQVGATRAARVTYMSPGWVFLDAGSADGLREGSRADIVRRGRLIAQLRVESVGEHQASCAVVSAHLPPRLGDSVRFVPAESRAGRPPVAARRPPPAPRAPPASAPSRDSIIRAPREPSRLATDSDGRRSLPPPATAASPSGGTAPRDSAPGTRPVTRTADAIPPSPPKTPATASRAVPVAKARTASGGAAGAARNDTARVTFLTSTSVYVSAGKGDGLAVGSPVQVVRGGRAVAELTVAFVSTHQASCHIVSKADSVKVGDMVRFVPVATPRDSAASAAEPAAPPVRRASRSGHRHLRGRVGLHYLLVQQRDSFGGQFSQPAADIRLTGAGLGDSPMGLVLDVRTRRQVRELPGSPTSTGSQTRVYQAMAIWDAPGSPFRFTTGRHYAPGISSVGLLDGVSAEVIHAGWDYGVFAGLQPELVNLGFSREITQLGGFVRRHDDPTSVRRWSMTLGASGSRLDGNSNRDFLYLQANYLARRVSLYAVQEVDYYRASRRVDGERAVSPTSTFANLQYQLTGAFTLTAGVDNRRSVRLYRDVIDPATEFDDAFRRGVWAGFMVRAANHFRASFDARTNDGGSSAAANTYTLALGAERLTPLGASLRSRSTRYTTDGREGWLNAVSIGLEPFGRGSAQLTTGWRTERGGTTAPMLGIRWTSLDMDVSIARSLLIVFSGYRERGEGQGHDQLYAGLSYRF